MPQRDQPSDVCFICYAVGHRAPNCPDANRPPHDPHFQRRLYDNYQLLTNQQKDFLRAVGRAPIIIGEPSVLPQKPSHSTTSNVTPAEQPKELLQRPNDGNGPSISSPPAKN